MATTKYLLSERISIFLQGGRNDDSTKADIREIKLAVESVANKLLKVEYMSENIAIGEAIPNGMSIAEYTNIPVYPYNGVSASTLPAMPVKLPRGMGVFDIYAGGDNPNAACSFIPLQWGDLALLKGQPMISDLAGMIGFIPMGMRVIYNKDITIPDLNIPVVNMRLVILDFRQYTDTDILPLTPELEWDIILEVCKFYGQEPDPSQLDVPGLAVPPNNPNEMQP